ncbi:MAG: hypothetical protein J1F38_04065 [Muribaculaceae bacterium]|nr:hypothetical protein [Muribaculaceae bacterium]
MSALMFLYSCQSDISPDNGNEIPANVSGVIFSAKVDNSVTPTTRALTQDPEPVRQIDFPNNFYIQMVLEDNQVVPENSQKISSATYRIPSGSQAYLQYKYFKNDVTPDTKQGLNWGNATVTYNFWSWTTPWKDEFNIVKEEDPNDPDTPVTGEPENQEPEQEIIPDLTPQFVPIKSTTKFGQNDRPDNNNAYLEQFIGAKSGPHSFKSTGNGEVDLQFRHLVSKIIITRFSFIDMYGSTKDGEKAYITFLNMPEGFMFYPHPDGTEEYIGADGQTHTLQADGAPIAVGDFEHASKVKGPTFAINNEGIYDKDGNLTGGDLDMFYICPEVDFSKIEFMVVMNNPDYNKRGAYFGTFENVIFERDPENAPDYDNKFDPDSPDSYTSDTRILHAGEVMEFNLQVKEVGGSGIGITIRDWDSHLMAEANYHPHKGFYDSSEAQQAKDLFGKAKNETTRQQADIFFELYGDGVMPDDESVPDYFKDCKIFKLYSEIIVAKSSANSTNGMNFPIWGEYVLDGMGYTINFQPIASPPVPHVITIGKMKDVYLTDGFYTAYVDEEGKVWIKSSVTGDYILTDRFLSQEKNELDLEALTKDFSKT